MKSYIKSFITTTMLVMGLFVIPTISSSAAVTQALTVNSSGTVVNTNNPIVFPNAVTMINTGNSFAGTFTGYANGGGFATRRVIDVTRYGAIPNGSTDCTLAISNAQVDQVRYRLPLYFPGTTNGQYYKINGPLRQYSIADSRGVNIVSYDTSQRIEIIGDTGAAIVQAADESVFVFTNEVNFIEISGIKFAKIGGIPSSTKPAVGIYSESTVGGNTDHVIIDNSEFIGFNQGIYSESGCVMLLSQCSFALNGVGIYLAKTNSAGVSLVGNNTVTILSSAFVDNYNGSVWMGGGFGLLMENCEMGGTVQTNIVTAYTQSQITLSIRNCNIELAHGAVVEVRTVNGNAGIINILCENVGLRNFGSDWLLWSTNSVVGPNLTSINNFAGKVFDCSANNSIRNIGLNSLVVVGTNASVLSGAWFTNASGVISRISRNSDGQNYDGQEVTGYPEYENQLTVKYGFSGNRSGLIWGMISNQGPNQVVVNVPLNKYNMDLADGKIVGGAVSNNFTAGARFAGGMTIDTTVPVVIRGNGPLLNFGAPVGQESAACEAAFGVYNYSQDEFGVWVSPGRGIHVDGATGKARFYHDTALNRTHIGWNIASVTPSQSTNSATLNVHGSGLVHGSLTADGVISGDGSGITNLNGNTLSVTATNRLVFTSVSALTNTLGREAFAIVSAGTSVVLQDTNGVSIATLGTIATLDLIVPMHVNMSLSGTGVSAILY